MSQDERITVGKFVGVYGVKGWLKVKSYTDPDANILSYSPWYVKTPKGLKVFEIDDSQLRPQGLVVHLAGLDDRSEALEVRGEIQVERSQLPTLDGDDFYWHQLIGLNVVSEFGGVARQLGMVKGLMETGANDVLVIEGSAESIDQRQRLVPYVPGQFVTEIDIENGLIRVDWDPDF